MDCNDVPKIYLKFNMLILNERKIHFFETLENHTKSSINLFNLHYDITKQDKTGRTFFEYADEKLYTGVICFR